MIADSPSAVLGVVALDHARDGARQPPAPREHAPDERVVDAELAPLALDPLLRRPRLAVDLARIAGVCVDEHELADVVQQRGDHQPVAELVVQLAGEPVGGALGRDRVQPEPLGDPLPDGGALEEVECARAAGDREHGPRRQHLDPLDRALDPPVGASVDLVGEPQHRDRQRHVGLDRGHDVRRRRARPPRTAAAHGCATRPAPGTPRAPRTRRSAGGRGPRCDGARATA